MNFGHAVLEVFPPDCSQASLQRDPSPSSFNCLKHLLAKCSSHTRASIPPGSPEQTGKWALPYLTSTEDCHMVVEAFGSTRSAYIQLPSFSASGYQGVCSSLLPSAPQKEACCQWVPQKPPCHITHGDISAMKVMCSRGILSTTRNAHGRSHSKPSSTISSSKASPPSPHRTSPEYPISQPSLAWPPPFPL